MASFRTLKGLTSDADQRIEKRKSNLADVLDIVEMSGGISARRTEVKVSEGEMGVKFDFG